MIYMHENVINQLFHGSAHVCAIMHLLTLMHYCIIHCITKTYTQNLDNNHSLSITYILG